MPAFRVRSSFFGLAAAALLAGALAVPARAHVGFGHAYVAAWGCYATPPYHACSGHPGAIAFPGHARIGGWLVAGFPFAGGVHGAAGRLYQR